MANEIAAFQMMVRNEMALLRLCGMTLAMLRRRGVLTTDQVHATIEEARKPLQSTDAFQQALTALQDELRQ